MNTLKIQKLGIDKLIENPDNPRTINAKKFNELVESIREFPDMLSLKPIIVDEDMIIIGGNMRYRACVHLGFKDVPVINYTKDYHYTTLAYKNDNKSYEDTRDEFIIKDNISFGQWDWDILANSWESSKLNEWGLGVWENTKVEEKEFKPLLFPTQSKEVITDQQIRKAEDNIGSTFQKGTERKFIETMCPHCGHEFNVAQE